MKPQQFVNSFRNDSLKCSKATGISPVFILAQAALESGWGEAAPGNMFFGVKDTDGINGNEQLITTTEYHTSVNVKYPVVISITPVIKGRKKMFKYKIKDYFRKFESPADSFIHHGQFFLRNKRYAEALKVRDNPVKFAEAIAAAGYATDPNYANTLKKMISIIQKLF